MGDEAEAGTRTIRFLGLRPELMVAAMLGLGGGGAGHGLASLLGLGSGRFETKLDDGLEKLGKKLDDGLEKQGRKIDEERDATTKLGSAVDRLGDRSTVESKRLDRVEGLVSDLAKELQDVKLELVRVKGEKR